MALECNSPIKNLSQFMQNVLKGEKVYLMFKRNKNNQARNKSYFNHAQSRAIKKKFEKFLMNPEDAKNCKVNLGFYTIDFKSERVYQTADPANKEEQYEFAEATNHERERSDPSRFFTNIADESLKQGNEGEQNKLGSDWSDKYD